MRISLLLSFTLAGSAAFAALEPIAPIGGQEIPLVSDAQKQVMNQPTLEERISVLAKDRETGKRLKHDKFWRKSLPLLLELRVTQGEKGPWKVLLGKKSDLSDAQVWYVRTSETDKATGRETEREMRRTSPALRCRWRTSKLPRATIGRSFVAGVAGSVAVRSTVAKSASA